jgi:ribonuclease D
MKRHYLSFPDAWQKRPLPQLLINYACGDVRVLFPLYHAFTSLFTSRAEKQYIERGNKAQLTAYRDNTAPQPSDTYELI